MSIVGIAAWVAVFVIGATLIHTLGSEFWGILFVMICGAVLGTLVARLP
ncbi:hypothetical protein LCGC14_3009930 [marine sediment metagenome]|uniref:Uncharacterized protein n=1 Tax=marine sediment metagenome TaxID=412755 RepID=A0A0F8XLC9_9ZZZZ